MFIFGNSNIMSVMRKYPSIAIAIVTSIIYKVFAIGIYDYDNIFMEVFLSSLMFSTIMLSLPMLLAFLKKNTYWEVVNQITSYVVAICIIFIVLPGIYNEQFSGKSQVEEVDKDDSIREVKMTWKQFLKHNGIAIDGFDKNEFESIGSGNNYTNHYYHVTSDFPDDWEIDRGNAEHTIFRASVVDKAVSLSLNVVPDQKIEEKKFLNAPLQHMNELSKGNDYHTAFREALNYMGGVNATNIIISERTIRSRNHLKITYNYYEETDDLKILFKSCSYQTMAFNLIYTYTYSAPEIYYEEATIDDVVFSANYVRIPNPAANF